MLPNAPWKEMVVHLFVYSLFLAGLLRSSLCAELGHVLHDEGMHQDGPPNMGDNTHQPDQGNYNGSTRQQLFDQIIAAPDSRLATSMLHRRDASWRAEILASVTEITFSDYVWPGEMIVYGENAEVIGTNTNTRTYMAVAELNSGRIVALAHETQTNSFLDKAPTTNQQFIKNVKAWVTKGGYTSDDQILQATALGDLDNIPATCKILVWVGKNQQSQKFYDNMITWIKNGGGMVCGYQSWKYADYHPTTPLWEMPLSKVLNLVGISYLDNWMAKGEDYKVDADAEKRAETAQVGHLVNTCKNDVSKLETCRAWLEWIFKLKLSKVAFGDILSLYTNMLTFLGGIHHYIPSNAKPVNTEPGRNVSVMVAMIFLKTGQFNNDTVAPGIEDFPGKFPEPPQLTEPTFTASFNSTYSKVYPTGYYLPAGQELVLSWKTAPSKYWQIWIGTSHDWLFGKRDSFYRWPMMLLTEYLVKSPFKIRHPFGGNIYIKSPSDVTESFTLKMENVVETPIFTPGQGQLWESSLRNRKGLYADIVGEKLMITLPSSSIRNLTDPTDTVKLWDKVVQTAHDFLTFDPYGGRGQWVLCDRQISVGYMHAGYPIGATLNVADPTYLSSIYSAFLLNREVLQTKGNWAMFHEIGHNMQYSSWTFAGTGEVTNNVFVLYLMYEINGVKPWQSWMLKHFKSYFEKGAKFVDWTSSHYTALGIYAQMARDFGFDSYKAIFKEYHALPNDQLPKDNDERIDQWITRFSKQVKRNLCPQFEFWGFTIRNHISEAVKDLPGFLPSDETTLDMAPDRAKAMMEKYNVAKLGL